MKSKMMLACAGLAVCSSANAQQIVQSDELMQMTVRPFPLSIASYEKVLGFDADGQPIFGEKIYVDEGVSANASRGSALTPILDLVGRSTTDGDGVIEFEDAIDCSVSCAGQNSYDFVAGTATLTVAPFPVFSVFDAYSVDSSLAGTEIDGFSLDVVLGGCVEPDPIDPIGMPGDMEPFSLVAFWFDSADLTLNGDGTDGFEDPNAPGSTTFRNPFEDGTFLTGVRITFNPDPVTGDPLPVDQGAFRFDIDGLVAAGIAPVVPSTNHDGSADGSIDFTQEYVFTQGGFVISTEAFVGLGSSGILDTSGCRAATGSSSDGIWGRGFNQCGDAATEPGWSDEGAVTTDLNVYEPGNGDVKFFAGDASGCPSSYDGPATTLWAFGSAAPSRLCGDVNDDGTVDDSDFFAWVTAFIASPPSPADLVACDVNNDGDCNDSDFFAWVTEFINAGSGGVLTDCPAIP
ncbi:MAG: dockerin type I repeat-containing protein [Planctomycetota bacterium]